MTIPAFLTNPGRIDSTIHSRELSEFPSVAAISRINWITEERLRDVYVAPEMLNSPTTKNRSYPWVS
ncbi:hypothetical protein WN55_04091 [Dufourea novaeangliae]|uniref:Uncharacterized protein n=1 Tax=Dufourea novaeangliae TaxID=178035 RepID=A0A154PKA2_DUFNO|nr:hypothetical protein WN55_04091 [Dufourea novaeangliae]